VLPSEEIVPVNLHRAMRYSVLAPGKRLRPTLVIAGAEASAAPPRPCSTPACALELIHAYSLIHDDLPAMDDDDYRRGRLTNHKVFGEAMAILAGDALLTLAFRLVADNASRTADAAHGGAGGGRRRRRRRQPDGMVGGQVIDIESEGKDVGLDTLEYIHRHKTAALIRVSLTAGATLSGGTPAQIDARAEGGRVARRSPSRSWMISSTWKAASRSSQDGRERREKEEGHVPGAARTRRLQAQGSWAHRRDEAFAGAARPSAEPIRALADFVFDRRS